MEQRRYKLGLIPDRRTAAIALCSTGFIAVQSFRAVFSHAPRNSHWLFPLDFMSLPIWFGAIVNLSFYVCTLWACVEFYRIAQGKERIVVAGWFNVMLLSPVQNLVSPPHAAAIQWVKAAGMAVAFLAATYILLKSPASAEGITKMAKRRLLVLCAVFVAVLVLGALLYFVPML
jgi:hypothetical protein